MPWTAGTFKKRHLGGKGSKKAADAGAGAANSALESCLKQGKSRKFCEGYAVRVGKSVAGKVKE